MKGRERALLYQKYGPWALVTGASAGIGRELSRCLLACGFSVCMVGRNFDEELLAGFEDSVTRIIRLDLAEEDSTSKIIDLVSDLDIGLLVCSAGFGTAGQFIDGDLRAEDAMLTVNCRSLMLLTYSFAKRFTEKRRGGIILMSSIVGFQGMPYAANYAATKAYVQTFAEALHEELRAANVDVLAAAPGPTESKFGKRAGMRMKNVLKPADVSWPILKALGKKNTVLPGSLSKFLVYALLPLPRSARIKIMGYVMKNMTEKK